MFCRPWLFVCLALFIVVLGFGVFILMAPQALNTYMRKLHTQTAKAGQSPQAATAMR